MKLLTKILLVLGVRVGIQLIFQSIGGDVVSAGSLADAVQEKIYTYNSILNILYLALRPALTLAGMAMDNSMVYGSFLNLDAPLWLIRNIVKNIANFALGFLVLFEILKNFFTVGDQGKKAFSVIKKALVAGVFIQMSWFMMAALIDISTITTYAVGSIPLFALDKQCPDVGKIKTLGAGFNYNFTKQSTTNTLNDAFMYYYYVKKDDKTKTNFSPCVVKNNKWVVGQQYRGTVDGLTFKDDYCILSNNQFVYFGKKQIATSASVLGGNIAGPMQYATLPDPGTDNDKYQTNLRQLVVELSGNKSLYDIWAGQELIFNTRSGTKKEVIGNTPGIYLLNATSSSSGFLDVFAGATDLKDIINKSEGFVGVLINLYKSILNFSSFNTSSGVTDTFVMFLEILLKVVFGIALLAPLIITAVALVIRIGYIWMLIALSPFIALNIAFTEGEGDFIGKILKHIPILGDGMRSIMRIVFAPMLVTFAVSLAMVFMSVLITSLRNENPTSCITDSTTVRKAFNVDTTKPNSGNNAMSYQVGRLVEVQQSAFGLDVQEGSKDIFGRFLINIFGAAIVWLLMMVVINVVFKGTPVGDMKLDKVAANLLSSLPFIPVPTKQGMQFIGAGTAGKIGEDLAQLGESYPAKRAQELITELQGEGGKPPTDEKDKGNAASGGTTSPALPKFDDLQQTALATQAATGGFTTLDASTLFEKDATLKGLTPEQLGKKVITDKQIADKYTTAINAKDSTAKKAKWDETTKRFTDRVAEGKFTTDELNTLWTSNYELAKRLAPTKNNSIVKIGADPYDVNFDDTTGTYKFVINDAKDVTPDYKSLSSEASITDRSKPVKNLRLAVPGGSTNPPPITK